MKKNANVVTEPVEATEVTPTTVVIPADFKMKPGRPVDPTSKRQADEAAKHEQRLAIYKAKLKSEGKSQEEIDATTSIPAEFKLKQGRPVVPGSDRQARLAKGSVGNGKQGRPANPFSDRQQKLNQQMVNRTKAYLQSIGIADPSSVKVIIEAPKVDKPEPVFSEEMAEAEA